MGTQRIYAQEEFIFEARSHLYDIPGFQALEWVDKDFFVRWIAPIEGNENLRLLIFPDYTAATCLY